MVVQDCFEILAKFVGECIVALANLLKIVKQFECSLFGELIREDKSLLILFFHINLGCFEKQEMNLKL